MLHSSLQLPLTIATNAHTDLAKPATIKDTSSYYPMRNARSLLAAPLIRALNHLTRSCDALEC